MLERILVYERDAFLWLNGSHTAYWDNFMWLFSGKIVWLPLAVFILGVLVYKKNWRESVLILLAIALTITLCDQFASHLCKPLFTRFRPTHHPDFMNQVQVVFGYRGGAYGFISSHAANAFGFATFMSLLFRNKLFTGTILLWSFVTVYTRIYLGVHFISDIIPGIASGCFFGYIVYLIYVKARRKWLPEGMGKTHPCRIYTEQQKRMIVYAIFATILILLIFNKQLLSCLK